MISYKPTDRLLTYASYSRGYKAAGSTSTAPASPGQPQPRPARFFARMVDAFEIGAKFNGRWIDVNVAAFDEELRNFQLNTFNGVNFLVENINSCSADLAEPTVITASRRSPARARFAPAFARGASRSKPSSARSPT